MIREFKFFYDNSDTQFNPDFRKEEIYTLLNEAQERYVKTRYNRNNLYTLGFEEMQKRTDDLNAIKITQPFNVSTVSTETHTYQVNISDPTNLLPYQFYIRGRVRLTSGTYTQWVPLYIRQTDDLDKVEDDPFNEPDPLHPVGYFEGGKIYILLSAGVTPTDSKITYLTKPKTISDSQDCELSQPKEIIQLAVNIAIELGQSSRVATHQNQLQTLE